jgi:WD40 repeat protein
VILCRRLDHELDLEQLTIALRERRLAICVGPRLAEAAGLPTPNSLAVGLLAVLRAEQPELSVAELERMIAEGDDAEALEALAGDLGDARFTQLIRGAYGRQQDVELPALARRIAGLRARLHSVYTTNLDRLLGRAMQGEWAEVSTIQADAAVRGRMIVKLCGSVDEPANWVLTKTQHQRARERNVDLRETLCATFRARTILFVGFDGHRSALEQLLDVVAEAYTTNQGPTHFIAADDEAWDRYALRSLRGRGLVVLPNAAVDAWMERRAIEGIIDFTAERARHEHFFGREDVFEALDVLLGAGSSGWVVLTGGPGMGKSALLERWLRRREQAGLLTAYHFIRRGHQDWAEPEAVRANLAAQIEVMFPEQRDVDALPRTRLEQLLVRVGGQLEQRAQQLVLLVDGLDEAMAPGQENPIPQMFPHELPARVFVVVASRPRYPYLNWFAQRTGASHAIDLDARGESNEAAVREYWAVLGPKMDPPLTAELERLAIERADGNLLHAVKLWQLWSGPVAVRSADRVPAGFEGMLEELWERIGSLPAPSKKRTRDGLALVCAARESLPLAAIEELLEWDEGEAADEFLPAAREMLLEERWHDSPAYRPFHEGLRELVERKLPKAAQRNDVALASFAVWPPTRGEFWRRYALRHRVTHQVEGGLLDDAAAMCADVGYLTAKAREVGVTEVERDLRLTTTALPDGRVRQRLTTLSRVVGACSHSARRVPEALPSLLYDRLLTNAPQMLDELVWPTRRNPAYLRLRHPLQKSGLSRVFEAHLNAVNAVAVLPDGRIVSGSADRTLRVWDVESGASVATLHGHQGPVGAVAVLADGRIVSGARDNTLRVWSLESGTCTATFEGHKQRVNAVAVLADGRIVSASLDNSLRVWDVESGTTLAILEGHLNSVNAVAVLADGRIVSASSDKSLRVWDLESGRCVATLVGHQDRVNAVAVLGDGRIVSASTDNTVRVWNVESGSTVAILTGHRLSVLAVAVLDDRRIVTGSIDLVVRVWDVESGQSVATLVGHQDAVSALAVLADGRIVSSCWDGTVRVWDVESATSVGTRDGHQLSVNAVAALPDGRVVSGSSDDTVRVWDVESGTSVATFGVGYQLVIHLVITVAALPDGRVVFGNFNNTLCVWDIASGSDTTLKGHQGSVAAVAVLPDGRIVSGSWDKTLRVWDLESGTTVATLEGHQHTIHAVAVLPNGRIVSGSRDNTLRVWDLESGTSVATLEGHRGLVSAVAVLPDGRVVSGSEDNTLRVWDVESGSTVAILEGHRRWIRAVAVLPDGRVVSGSEDNTLRIWDLDSGSVVATALGDSAFVSVAAVDDSLLVAGDRVGNVWFIELTDQ